MDMTGEYRIPAPRERVWEGLNDPEILRQSIPGCEQLDKVSDTELTARVKAKVGPVSATFNGKVTLSDLNPPESYTISGEGSGGVAGFAKGGAHVHLTEEGSDTLLRYDAKADVGGKLAQIGSRLVQGTAKKMADDFFSRFSRIVAERHAVDAEAMAAATAGVAEPPPPPAAPIPASEPTVTTTRVEPGVPPTLPAEAAAGGTPPYVPDAPPVEPTRPEPVATRPSQFVRRETVTPPANETARPEPVASPAASTAAREAAQATHAASTVPQAGEPGLFQRPLTWVAVAVIVLILLFLIF